MLFLKRASDLFDERREVLRQQFAAQGMSEADIAIELDDPDHYSGKYFYVQRPALKHVKENVGTTLNKALAAIEDAKPDALRDDGVRSQTKKNRFVLYKNKRQPLS